MQGTRHIGRLLVVSVSAMLGTVIRAQSQAVSGTAPICPAGRAPRVDAVVVTVTVNAGTAWNSRRYSDTERTLILNCADVIRQRSVPPASLSVIPVLAEYPLSPGAENRRATAP